MELGRTLAAQESNLDTPTTQLFIEHKRSVAEPVAGGESDAQSANDPAVEAITVLERRPT